MVKNYDDMLTRFHLIPERNDRRTDKQTDLLYQYLTSDKNRLKHYKIYLKIYEPTVGSNHNPKTQQVRAIALH